MGDHAIKDIKSFEHQAEELKIAEELLRIRTARMSGAQGYSVAEVRKTLGETIDKRAAITAARFVDYRLSLYSAY